MKVIINTQTTSGQKSGFGFYTANLLAEVPKVAEVEYIEVAPADHSINHLSTPQRFSWDQLGFAWRALRSSAPVVHQPNFSAPLLVRLFSRKKVVVTTHDIIPTLFPENMSLPSRLFFGHWMPFSFKFAHRCIAISEHTKRDLITHLGLKAEKITVIPEAAGAEYHPLTTKAEEKTAAEICSKYGIEGEYFLHVGTLEPRKNLVFLVKAYAQAVQDHNLKAKLVIAGKKGWRQEELYEVTKKLQIEDQVVFTGYIPDTELPSLYAKALAFVFPSLYEGFGLPPLEAMASGVPVISSNTSSMPEVVGEAGILLSPHYTEGWAEAMHDLATNSKKREQLRKAGLQQAGKFSWEKTARATAVVYQEISK